MHPRGGNYDVVIRTQAEFEALIASPTWLDAVSVCFVGDGGNLKFTSPDGQGCKIPQTVKQIQGMNSAIIEVTNSENALWYATLPTTADYWINGMTVNCTGTGTGYGFYDCKYLNGCKQGTASTTAFLGGTNTKVDTLTGWHRNYHQIGTR